MARALRIIGTIAGVVGLVATGLGAFGVPLIFGASATTIAGIAAVVGGVAGIGAQLLTKPPPPRGSVTQTIISPDAPMPYGLGEGLLGGVARAEIGYGATLNGVPNPYKFIPMVFSLGTIGSITPYVDQAAVGSYYTGYLYTDTQLGARPEADALAPQWSGAPGWTSASKLSGKAAIGWSFKFDKDGKRFASGLPALGAYGQWSKVYDPRLDSTFPGGFGACRLDDEDTYVWSESPALHAAQYAYGRYQNGKLVFGVGLEAESIVWPVVAAWAEVCEANGWTVFGRIFEPGDRGQNLLDICIAGGALPIWSGGRLSFHYAAPRVPLDTATDADLAGDEQSVTAMATDRERINTVVPACILPTHNYELTDLAKVAVSTFLTEDGEEKVERYPFNLVKNPDQAAMLATYRLWDGRELQPIEITYGERMFAYRPGQCLQLDHPELGLDTPAVILHRRFDPAGLTVTFTMIGETPGKHAFALGETGTPPATPALGQTAEERDAIAAAAAATPSAAHRLVEQSDPFPMVSDDDSITINAFTGVVDDGRAISFPSGSLTGLASSAQYAVFYDPVAASYSAVGIPVDTEMADSSLIFIQWQATSSTGTFPTPLTPPDGYGGPGVAWDQFAQ